LTPDSRVNDTIGNKIEENTDKDGFTNVGAHLSTAPEVC
jgi:hypothetical protein